MLTDESYEAMLYEDPETEEESPFRVRRARAHARKAAVTRQAASTGKRAPVRSPVRRPPPPPPDPAASPGDEDAAAEEFFPADLAAAFAKLPTSVRVCLERSAVRRAIQQGERSAVALTDKVFFGRHPERGGRSIEAYEKDLAAEWKDIKARVVDPVLADSGGSPGTTSGGSNSTSSGYGSTGGGSYSGATVNIPPGSIGPMPPGWTKRRCSSSKRVPLDQLGLTTDLPPLGTLSEKHESGGDPGCVSSGTGDAGGVSYGRWQMASKAGVPDTFVQQSPYAAHFRGLSAGTPEFTYVWQQVADRDPVGFTRAQWESIRRTHYGKVVSDLKRTLGLDPDTRTNALRQVVWSFAVGAPNIGVWKNTLAGKSHASMSDEALIRAVFIERMARNPDGSLKYFSKNARDVQESVARRLAREMDEALQMLAAERKRADRELESPDGEDFESELYGGPYPRGKMPAACTCGCAGCQARKVAHEAFEPEWETESPFGEEAESPFGQEAESEQEGEIPGAFSAVLGALSGGALSLARAGVERASIALAIAQGIIDPGCLTAMVFYLRHPELLGRAPRSDETALINEWRTIKESLVLPALGHTTSDHEFETEDLSYGEAYAGEAELEAFADQADECETTAENEDWVPGAELEGPAGLVGGTFTVIDSQAILRAGPPSFSSAGKIVPKGTTVVVTAVETTAQGVYVLVRLPSGSEAWTKISNLSVPPGTVLREIPPGAPEDSKGPNAAWDNGRYIGQIRVYEVVGTGGRTVRVSADSYPSFQAMAQAARAEGVEITITSGFRTYGEQAALRAKYDAAMRTNPKSAVLAAKPGYSNHQDGVALDLSVGMGKGNPRPPTSRWTATYKWLVRNASRFGFVRAVESEPWHWEYQPSRAASDTVFGNKPQLLSGQ